MKDDIRVCREMTNAVPDEFPFFPKSTLGIDLGDRFCHCCALDYRGEVVERFRFEATKADLAKAFENRPPGRVVLEVGTHSPWVSRALGALGHEVIVANAREVQSITKSDRKNDANDAEQLARLGRVDPKLLHPIAHRQEDTQRDRALLTVRDKLVQVRASRSVSWIAKSRRFRRNAIPRPSWSARSKEWDLSHRSPMCSRSKIQRVLPAAAALASTSECVLANATQEIATHTSRLAKRGIPTYESSLWNALSTFCREAQTAICVASVNVL
jgi:hypothetical protein